MYRAPRIPVALASLVIVVFVLLVSSAATAQTTSDVFSVVLLPDTQYYSASHPAIFNAQTQWIVDNMAAGNIQMVIGEGDIVDSPGIATQWANADAAVKILDGKIPYALAIGNHDYDGVLPQNRGVTAFNQHFGPSRYAAYAWYGGNFQGRNENFYTFFTVNGQKYMVLALEYYPRNSVLTWASSVIDSHPEAKVMVTTHSFVYTDGTRGDRCDTNDMSGSVANGLANNAEEVWQKLLSQKANVMLVVSGHLIGNNTAHRTDLGVNGNVVNQIFTNFQNITNGGNGYLRILTFHPSENRIDVSTYSPYLNASLTSAAHQFSLPITNAGNTATPGAIGGKVRTPQCKLIAGAQVSTAGFTATADANGVFKLSGLAPNGMNGYSVGVNAAGYQPVPPQSGTVNAGYTDQVDFYLTATNTAPCTLSTVDPSVTLCTPAANATVTSPIHVVAGATSSKSVSYMQLYMDGVKKYQVSAKTLDTTLAAAAGTHRLTVQFANSSGVITKNSISVTVGSSAPGTGTGTTVSITSPVNGATATSPVHVAATVTSSKTISYTQVYVDGVAKYTVNGKTVSTGLAMTAGSHRVTVQAKDSAGVFTKQSVTITVK
jgi:hypothetical protein